MKVRLNLNKLCIFLFVMSLSILLIARDVFSVSISKYVYLVVCTVFLCIADASTQISMISFLLPLMCGIPSTYVLLVIMVLMIVKKRIEPITALLCLLYATLELLALLHVNVFLNSTVVKQILFICVFWTMLHINDNIDYVQCMKLYFLGVLLVSFVIDAYSIIRAPADWLSLFAKGWYRFGNEGLEGIESMTLRLNPISLGYFCASGFLVGLVLLVRTTGWNRVLILVGIAFLALSAILAVSRSFVLVIAGCFFLIMLSNIRKPHCWGRLIGAVFWVMVIGGATYLLYPEVFAGMISRMTDSSMEGGNGRVELMIEYVNALSNTPRGMLVGVGASYTLTALNVAMSIHNATIQILVSYGIWGGLLFLLAMLYPLRRKGNEAKVKIIYWLPFIGTFVYMQTIQFLNPCFHMMAYVMTVYAVKAGRTHNSAQRVIRAK